MTIVDRKITQSEFDTMASPLELDLIAFFKVLEEQVLSSTFNTDKTPDELISEIDTIFQPETGSISVQKEDRPTHYKIFQGMLIGIENAKGTTRSGTDPDGHKWSIRMRWDYGYIWNVSAIDGDSLDCYIGPSEIAKNVYVVSQVDPKTRQFDEYKIMLGFDNEEEAKIAYRNQYDSPEFFGGIKKVPLDKFKNTIFGGSHAKS